MRQYPKEVYANFSLELFAFVTLDSDNQTLFLEMFCSVFLRKRKSFKRHFCKVDFCTFQLKKKRLVAGIIRLI